MDILRRDNERLRTRDAERSSAQRRLETALGVAKGQDVAAKAAAWKTELQAAQVRIAQLQAALGIGSKEEQSPSQRGFSKVEDASDLSAYGHLLRLTTLARTSPGLQSFYNASPTQLRTPEGDLWTAGIQEELDENGVPIRVVVVRLEPRAYAHQAARARLLQLESSLATAVRENAASGRRLAVFRDGDSPEDRREAETQRLEARRRGEEIKAEIERLRPLAEEPKAREWRFVADFERAFRLSEETV